MLPTELRNATYELVLVASRPLRSKHEPQSHQEHRTHIEYREDFSTTLLQVSRQVRQEALPTFWGMNTFKTTIRCRHPRDLSETLQLRTIKRWNFPLDGEGAAIFRNLRIELSMNIGWDPLKLKMSQLLDPNSHRTRDISLDEYADVISNHTGATLRQLGAHCSTSGWNQDIIFEIIPLAELAIEKSAVEVEISTWQGMPK